MGISKNFITWVKLLFGNAVAAVNLNGTPGNNFTIERGVKQDCLLVRYLFLIVGEVLTHIIKKAVEEGWLREIYLPGVKSNIIFLNTPTIPHLWCEGRKRTWTNL